ncbi:hypothetical protein KBY79_05945 [Synechococcus lacustris C3-12m-Tous]|uniref:hypothetical protein n=1 Tax=Synechococcus lacustris TaxID=2116544 RepID=UPI0020CD7277|nr:hypothetical protein [Synechococcus lacustris]MCP9924758.1 hypothetical protein [Synechococcus lacustris C3-12m-Tous]
MNVHQIGIQLRAQVLRDHQHQQRVNVQRLQALIADLCSDSHQELVPPLRHLVQTTCFAAAAAVDPPLTDGRHLHLLRSELNQVFAPTLCVRMQPLLEGLMGMAETAPQAKSTGIPRRSNSAQATRNKASVLANPSVNGVLAVLSLVLLVSLVVVGLAIMKRQSLLAPSSGNTTTTVEPPISAAPAAPGELSEQQETSTAPPGESSTSQEQRAVAVINELYDTLSAKEFEKSKDLYGAGAADQFGPGFFVQFKRVTAQNLRVTSATKSMVNLEGEVIFYWPDGSYQSETRSFSVNTMSQPALITASEFRSVIRPRQ